MPTKSAKQTNLEDIILLQAWYILILDEAFRELTGVVARQYDTIHKPKRGRKAKSASASDITSNRS